MIRRQRWPSALTQYAGISHRSGETSIELGVIHRSYDTIVDTAYTTDYFEGFIGITRKAMRLRLYTSPDYLIDGRMTYYGEFDAQLLKRGKWAVNGHAGLSVIPQDLGTPGGMRTYYDWSLSASHPIGGFDATLGLADTNYPVFSPSRGIGLFSNRPRVFASLSRAF